MIEFLSPVSKKIIAHREILSQGVLGKEIAIHTKKGSLPNLKGVQFALFGVKENRNDVNYMGADVCFDELRKALYALYPGNWPQKVVDLGDIEKGETVEDSYFAFRAVSEALLKKGIIPIVFGGSQDLLFPMYRSYDGMGKMVNLVNVDHRFDLGDAEHPISN
ncbi:MAG: arginase, partial [Bacteroidetes bacterium]